MLSGNALRAVRSSLRATSTIVTHRDGHRTVETSDGEVTSTLPPAAVLPPALAGDNERRRLHDELMVEALPDPTWALPASLSAESVMPPISLDCLRIVTWNVWFAPVDVDRRMAALFHEALDAAPDVLCLQEVVPELAASIRASEPLRSLYDISPNDVGAYGCLLLARRELRAAFSEVPFPSSSMGRSLVLAEWFPPFEDGGTIAVATVHLESLNQAKERARQLEIAKSALAGARRRVVLCGDFNFDATQNWGDWRKAPAWSKRKAPQDANPTSAGTGAGSEADHDSRIVSVWDAIADTGSASSRSSPALENVVLARVLGESYVDVWPAVHEPIEPGLTFDGAINPHIADGEERMRYDRVMVRGLVPRSMELLGAAAAREHHRRRCELQKATPAVSAEVAELDSSMPEIVVPSDHFGLCAVVELRLRRAA